MEVPLQPACLLCNAHCCSWGDKQLVAVNPIDAWRWAAAVTEPCHRTKRTAYSSVIWQMLLLSVCPVPRLDCTAYCAPLNVAITTLVTHRPNLNGAKNKHWLLKRPHLFPWGTHLYVTFIYLVFIWHKIHKQLDPQKNNMREKLSTALAQLLLSIGNDTFFL